MLVNRYNHTGQVAVATPTDRPKSVCNRYEIEVFWWRFCVVTLLFYFSLGIGACHRIESDLFLFPLYPELYRKSAVSC